MEFIAAIIYAIALIGGGIMTLRSGMIRATRRSVVEGRPARIIGWLLLITIPFAFLSAWVLPSMLRDIEAPVGWGGSMPLLAFCLPLVGCPLVAVVFGLVTAKKVQHKPVFDRPALGSAGRVVTALGPCGSVEIDGVCFPARSTQGDIAVGSQVVVTGFDPSGLFVTESHTTTSVKPVSGIRVVGPEQVRNGGDTAVRQLICLYCDHSLTDAEIQAGWCDSCGKKLPARR